MKRFAPAFLLLVLPLRAGAQCSSTWYCPGDGSPTRHDFSNMSECRENVEKALHAWRMLGGGGCTASDCSCSSGGDSSGGSDAAAQAEAAAAQAREYVNQLQGRNAELNRRIQALEGKKEELTRKKREAEERKRAREAQWTEKQRQWTLQDAKAELGRGLKGGAGRGLEPGFKDFVAEAENNRLWEKHRHAALALQKEATARDPKNKENETWCKLNTLLAPGPERARLWDRRCDPGGKVPPYVPSRRPAEAEFKTAAEPTRVPTSVAPAAVPSTPREDVSFPAPAAAGASSSGGPSEAFPGFKPMEESPAEAADAATPPAVPTAGGAGPPGLPGGLEGISALRPQGDGSAVRVESDEDARTAAASGFDDRGPLLAPETPEPPAPPPPQDASAAAAPEPRQELPRQALSPQEHSAPPPAQGSSVSAGQSAKPVLPLQASAPEEPSPRTPARSVQHCVGGECSEQRVIAALTQGSPAARLRRAADCAAAPFAARLAALGGAGEGSRAAFMASVEKVLEAMREDGVSAPASDDQVFSAGGREVQVVSRVLGTTAEGGGEARLDIQWSVNEEGSETEGSVLLYVRPDGTVFGQASSAVERCLTGAAP